MSDAARADGPPEFSSDTGGRVDLQTINSTVLSCRANVTSLHRICNSSLYNASELTTEQQSHVCRLSIEFEGPNGLFAAVNWPSVLQSNMTEEYSGDGRTADGQLQVPSEGSVRQVNLVLRTLNGKLTGKYSCKWNYSFLDSGQLDSQKPMQITFIGIAMLSTTF